MFLSSVEEYIFLPKMNQNAEFWPKKFSRILPPDLCGGRGTPLHNLLRPCPWFLTPNIFDSLPPLSVHHKLVLYLAITETMPYDSLGTLFQWRLPNGDAKYRWSKLKSAILHQYLAIYQKQCRKRIQLLWHINRKSCALSNDAISGYLEWPLSTHLSTRK